MGAMRSGQCRASREMLTIRVVSSFRFSTAYSTAGAVAFFLSGISSANLGCPRLGGIVNVLQTLNAWHGSTKLPSSTGQITELVTAEAIAVTNRLKAIDQGFIVNKDGSITDPQARSRSYRALFQQIHCMTPRRIQCAVHRQCIHRRHWTPSVPTRSRFFPGGNLTSPIQVECATRR
jgi:hypothetical protein